MTEAFVNRIIDQSFIDGPGNRTVVFLQGCDMRCLYCHNPETQNLCSNCGECVKVCPTGAVSLRGGAVVYDKTRCAACDRCLGVCPNFSSPKYVRMDSESLVSHIVSNVDFLDGITFSGGECTLQSGFIIDVFQRLKEQAPLTCFVDTNGNMKPEVLDALCADTDGFMFDLKALNAQKHKELTGIDNSTVLRNLQRASDHGLLYEVRTVLVEGYTNSEEEIGKIARFIKGLNDTTLFKLIPFRPYGVRTPLRTKSGPDRKRCEELRDIAKRELGERAVLITTAFE